MSSRHCFDNLSNILTHHTEVRMPMQMHIVSIGCHETVLDEAIEDEYHARDVRLMRPCALYVRLRCFCAWFTWMCEM